MNSSKGQITQETLNLIMFYHNHRRYKGGRRQGKAPIELLTGESLQGDWVSLFMQHKREAATKTCGALSPALEFVPNPHGPTSPPQTALDQATCESRAAAAPQWHATDAQAA